MIEDLQGDQMGFGLDGDAEPIEVSINQFYGIEINDFAVSVAKTALWIAEEQMMEATQEILLREFDFLPLKSNSNIREASMLTWRMRRAFSHGTAASRYATCLKSESVHSQSMAATTYSLNRRRKASWRLNLLPHVSFTLGSVRASFSMAKLDGVYGSEMLPYRTWLRCRAARRGLMPYATTGYQVKEGRP